MTVLAVVGKAMDSAAKVLRWPLESVISSAFRLW
jgi:hypothetical protein